MRNRVGLELTKATISKDTYYHISFNGGLQGRWNPTVPAGDIGGGEFKEPDWPRICVSSTLEGAFRAVYPNISQYFEVENYPHMDFYVYTPKGRSRILTSKDLVGKGFVHDAHVTGEVVLLDAVEMTLCGRIRVENTSKDSGLYYRPFNDKTLEERYHSPKFIRIAKL